jgi:signal transduction histidine kinase
MRFLDQRRLPWWLAPKPFDWVSSSLYLGILVISYFKLGIKCPCVSQMGAIGLTVTITIVILVLLSIDRMEYRWYGEEPPKRVAIVLLVIHILLIEGVVQLERFYFFPLNYAAMLYLIPPYLATLSFGHRIGFWIALLAGVVYVGQEMLYSLHWYNDLINLWTATLFCFALVFLLTMARVVSLEKASRMRAEQLLEEVARSHQQLTVYAEQVAELATIKERNRIARDIHDGLGHALMAINVQLEKALVYHERYPQEAVQAVGAAKQVAKEALQEVRGSVRALRLNQEDFSCAKSMTFLIQQLRKRQFSVDYYTEGDERNFSQEIRITLYRVAQESFTNIQKHAHAGRVQVTLQFDEQEARLQICDNGWGFDPERIQQMATDGTGGYGLQGMRERITLVHGHLHLDSSSGQGTALLVTIPKAGLVTHQGESIQAEKDGHDDES